MAPPKVNPHFDAAQLRKLQEPLTLYLAKVEGNRETPITLPPKDGYPPGQGFTYEEATQMSDVALKMGGGGDYRVLAIDNSGAKYEWKCWFPPTQFAAKAIDPVSQAAAAASGQAAPAPFVSTPYDSPWLQAQLAQPMPPPPQPYYQAPAPTPFPRAPYFQQPYGWGAPPYQPPAPAPASNDAALRAVEMQLVTERAKNELNVREAAHRVEMSALEAKLDRVMTALERPAPAPSGPSATELALAAEVRELRAKADQQAALAPILQQVQALTQLVAAPKGMDPVMQFVIESMKSQTEAAREAARLQAEVQKETARTAMTTKDVLDMLERVQASTGGSKIAEAYGGVMSLMQRSVEVMQNLGPAGPHPAVELVGQALTGIQEQVGKWVEGSNIEKGGKAQVAAIQAQAELEKQRVEQMRIQAEHEAAARAAQPQQIAGPEVAAEAATAEVAPEAAAVGTEAAPTRGQSETREEKDRRLFGPLVGHIEKFRAAAKTGKTEEGKEFTPRAAADAIFLAYATIQQQGIQLAVPGFALLESMQISQLVEDLLPNGPSTFVDDVIGEVNKIAPRYVHTTDAPGGKGKIHVLKIPPIIAPAATVEPEGDDDDEEEDDDDEEEEEAPPPAAAKAGKAAKKG